MKYRTKTKLKQMETKRKYANKIAYRIFPLVIWGTFIIFLLRHLKYYEQNETIFWIIIILVSILYRDLLKMSLRN